MNLSKFKILLIIPLLTFAFNAAAGGGGGGNPWYEPGTVSITNDAAGTVCEGQKVPITVSVDSENNCGNSGGGGNVAYDVDIYSNGATNSTVGGTLIATGSGSGINSYSLNVPTPLDCADTWYYYAEITWDAGGACAAGSITTATVAVSPTDCNCQAPSEDASVSDCGGFTWYDSGGSGGNYGNNESYTVTFCPDDPSLAVQVDFSSLDIEGGGGTCTDVLYLYMAADATGDVADVYCGTTTPTTITSTSDDGCVTFEFISDGATTGAGWEAAISCVAGCENPTGAIVDASMLNICSNDADNPGTLTVNFDGSASTAEPGWNLNNWEWDFGDGNTASSGSPTISHTYTDPGAYTAKLVVRDDNFGINPLGCGSTNAATRIVNVIPEPNTDATAAGPHDVSCDGCVTVTADAVSQTVIGNYPDISTGTVYLPDGTGASYDSPADYSGLFPDGATMDATCYPTVCLDIEHSWSGDLTIDLIAPSGQTVRLFNRHNTAGDGGTFSMFGECSNAADDGVPGCGATYCIVESGGADWTDGGQVLAAASPNGQCDIYDGECREGNGRYFIPGTYNSTNSLAALDGADLNGIWTIQVTDNQGFDDGFLFGWTLNFPAECFDDLESITPDLSTVSWSGTGAAGEGSVSTVNTTSTVVTDPGPDPCVGTNDCDGIRLESDAELCNFDETLLADETDVNSYDYEYMITDEFGCEYTKTLTVNHSCALLPVELIYFRGKSDERKNKLEWSTAVEIDNNYFIVEYSSDGVLWEEVAKVSGAGNSASTIYYTADHHSFVDDNINYYRLKQVDFNGESETFDVISIDNRKDVELIKRLNLLGQEVDEFYKGIVIEYYSDGTTKKVLK